MANKLSEEHKRNISLGCKKYKKTLEHRKNLSLARKGIVFSPEHRNNIRKALKAKGIKLPSRKGKKPWNWTGKKHIIEDIIRGSVKYEEWRINVFKRDRYTCQTCYKVGGVLVAHHKKFFSKILDEYKIETWEDALNCIELWDVNNGETLCYSPCHNKKHTHPMKRYRRKR